MSLDFTQARARILEAAQRGLEDAAEVVKQESIQRTPKETGELRNDCSIASGHLEAVVFYSLVYAIAQHEGVGFHHEHGEAKFLENALIATRGVVGQVIAQSIRSAL
ncbi:minor capsid protein [Rhodococcus sp. HM1]|uniref:minor capsid protein n=1 Tax=Rhodococcus sp. HM1 TaxID=2937759 RepID=UPI00200A9884|nr:minor capsid protein [Rhodococcus sp. HM1]MCK8675127.1 minor capsid protein [Rhodococcus sp. HM1]